MNVYFEVSAGVTVGVTGPDLIPRVRVPMPTVTHVGQLGAQPVDIKLAWLPTFPSPLASRRPVHPNWIGDFSAAALQPAIAPLSWAPQRPAYLGAPRLHRTFPRSIFDPLSGHATGVAQQMAWDPARRGPIVLRPRLRATTSVFFVTPQTVIAGEVSCIEWINDALTIPDILTAAAPLTVPALVVEDLTVPGIIQEDLC